MVRLLLALCLSAPILSSAQIPGAPQDEKNFTLAQRYWSMKSKAETYQDYKVVKEYVMDGVWKIAIDSLKQQRLLVADGKQTISKLETDLKAVNLTLTKEREASTEVVHASTHISVLGIDFKKGVFLIFITGILGLLAFIGVGMVAKIKFLRETAKEKIAIAEIISREFDEFKQKAMDKQIKLARELQTERNKLADLKQSPAH